MHQRRRPQQQASVEHQNQRGQRAQLTDRAHPGSAIAVHEPDRAQTGRGSRGRDVAAQVTPRDPGPFAGS